MILNVFSLQHERWYLEMNPRGEVPVLKHGDQIIIDSNVIIEVSAGLRDGLFSYQKSQFR
jgi:glutathione S-transferase